MTEEEKQKLFEKFKKPARSGDDVTDWTDDDLLEIKQKIIRKLGLKEDDPHDDGRRENG